MKRVRLFCLALVLMLSTACASMNRIQFGGGARGEFTIDDGHHESSIHLHSAGGSGSSGTGSSTPATYTASEFNIRGRTLDLELTCGVPTVQAVAGAEWARSDDENFECALLGVRVQVDAESGSARPYADCLGRRVVDRNFGHTLFDGVEVGLGCFFPIGASWSLEARLAWSYTNGDAIAVDASSVTEVRLGIGVHFGL